MPGRPGGSGAGPGWQGWRGRRCRTEDGRETGLKVVSRETQEQPPGGIQTGHAVPGHPGPSPTHALPGTACDAAGRLASAPSCCVRRDRPRGNVWSPCFRARTGPGHLVCCHQGDPRPPPLPRFSHLTMACVRAVCGDIRRDRLFRSPRPPSPHPRAEPARARTQRLPVHVETQGRLGSRGPALACVHPASVQSLVPVCAPMRAPAPEPLRP